MYSRPEPGDVLADPGDGLFEALVEGVAGFQPQSDWARAVPASRRSTSLAAGRRRSVSDSTSMVSPRSRPIRSTSSPIEMSSPRPMLTARPSAASQRGDRDEALDRVLDVGQVAARIESGPASPPAASAPG